VLQDITEDFAEPNIMDVKMGARTYGPDASKSKMAQVSICCKKAGFS
jgi:hypothetical protein